MLPKAQGHPHAHSFAPPPWTAPTYNAAVAGPGYPASAKASGAVLAAPWPDQAQGADLEPWRKRLQVGDRIYVKSASAGGWVLSRVKDESQQRVKVEYQIGNELCDKTLLRSSPDLAPVSEEQVAPQAQAQPAQAHAAQQAAMPMQRRWEAPVPSSHEQQRLSPQPQQRLSPQPPPPGMPALPATSLVRMADLQFGDLLGSGGFGSVYRGRLRGEDCEVAIKRLHPDGPLSREQEEEFQKEVKTLQTLRHPRLIRFIGVAWEPPQLCIVTELASGGSLFKLIHQDKVSLAEVRRRTLVRQMTEGVAFLHSLRPPRVHRDLKSANVVLDGDWNAKLCDFGLTESMEKTHLSRRETEGGSPRYMAPEVFDPRFKLTEKLDIWALGCLIVEVLIDKMPHDDCSTIQQVAAKVLVKQQPPFDESWANGITPEVVGIVQPCFTRNSAMRPSAAEVLSGLARVETVLIRSTDGLPAVEIKLA